MLFLEYESRKKKLLIFMCVLFFSVPGCRNGEEGNPFEGCPYSFLGVKPKTAGYGKLTRWIKLM